MRKVLQTFSRMGAYAACLVVLLSALSYWGYSRPEQLELRVHRYLSRFFRAGVYVGECAKSLGGPIDVASVTVPPAAGGGDAPVVVASGVAVEGLGDEMAELDSARDPSAAHGKALVGVGIDSAVFTLDRIERSRASARSATSWNVAGLVYAPAVQELLQDTAVSLSIARADLRFRRVREPDAGGSAAEAFTSSQKMSWLLAVRGVKADSISGDEIEFSGSLPSTKQWSSGRLQGSVTTRGEVEMHGHIDGVRNLSRWFALVDDACGGLCGPFTPVTPVDCELHRLRVAPGRDPELQATVHHYDSTLAVGSSGVELRHLKGPISVSRTRILLGGGVTEIGEPARPSDGDKGVPSAELWGMPVRVRGVLDRLERRLSLVFPRTEMEDVRTRDPDSPSCLVPGFLEALRPRGSVHGVLTVLLRTGPREDWGGTLFFSGLSFEEFPLVGEARGALQIARAISGGEPAGRSAEGRSCLVVDALSLKGVGVLKGEAPVHWEGDRIRLKAYLKLVGGSPGAAGQGGSIFGTVGWRKTTGALDLHLRATGLKLSLGLFEARDTCGELVLKEGDHVAACGMTFGKVSVAAGAFWPGQERLAFESGRCDLQVRGGSAEVRSVRLLGPRQCLRGRGAVSLSSGEVDLVLFLAQAPGHLAVSALEDRSTPADWKAAARGGFRAFRVSGTLVHPKIREVGPDDAAFLPAP